MLEKILSDRKWFFIASVLVPFIILIFQIALDLKYVTLTIFIIFITGSLMLMNPENDDEKI